ncbi:hypothetical protein AAC387_Pa04g2309 [Persea americana]
MKLQIKLPLKTINGNRLHSWVAWVCNPSSGCFANKLENSDDPDVVGLEGEPPALAVESVGLLGTPITVPAISMRVLEDGMRSWRRQRRGRRGG